MLTYNTRLTTMQKEVTEGSVIQEQLPDIREQKYTPFREVLDRGEVIFSDEPRVWWRRSYGLARRLQSSVQNNPEIYPLEMSSFIENYVSGIVANLADESKL